MQQVADGGGGGNVFDVFISQSVISATLTASENFLKLYMYSTDQTVPNLTPE